MGCWLVWSGVLGATVGVLGVLLLIIDLAKVGSRSAEIWLILSQNQKDFYGNAVAGLESQRRENILLAGIFAIVVAVVTLISVGCLFLLRREVAIRAKPASVSRLPNIRDFNGVCDFDYTCEVDEGDEEENEREQTQTQERLETDRNLMN